jgi:2-oxoglutarate dehydrogenase E2 component (dihydrolipoamide succinyltransferase)
VLARIAAKGEAARTSARAAAAAERAPARAPAPTPLARRAAAERGVELESVPGSGTRGRVTRADVERAAPPAEKLAPPATQSPAPAARPARPAAPALRPEEGPRPAYLDYQLQEGDEVIPMSPLRRLVAEHMVLSKRVSPHVGTVAEVDFAGVVRVRDAHKRAFEEANGFGLSFLPFVVHAAVRALREYPRLNASVVEDAIVEKRDIHMGIAVDTEKGLVVPVVRHADRLSLAGLAQAVEDLAARARTKKLSPDELKGGTFTISNPGRHGNLYGFAIINQPQVGILRMGEIVKRPVVRSLGGDDAIVIRPIMHLALSYDHRAVDGAPANGFLHRVRELLEEAEFDL